MCPRDITQEIRTRGAVELDLFGLFASDGDMQTVQGMMKDRFCGRKNGSFEKDVSSSSDSNFTAPNPMFFVENEIIKD